MMKDDQSWEKKEENKVSRGAQAASFFFFFVRNYIKHTHMTYIYIYIYI